MNLSNSEQTKSICSLQSKDRDRLMVPQRRGANNRILSLSYQEEEAFNLVEKKSKLAKIKKANISTFGSSRSRKRKKIKRKKELIRFEEKERNCRRRWIIILMASVGLELGQLRNLLLLDKCPKTIKTRSRT